VGLKLHNLRTDHVTIQSELTYLIGAKIVDLKCRVFGGNPLLTLVFQDVGQNLPEHDTLQGVPCNPASSTIYRENFQVRVI
jgi:hypothetical protein